MSPGKQKYMATIRGTAGNTAATCYSLLCAEHMCKTKQPMRRTAAAVPIPPPKLAQQTALNKWHDCTSASCTPLTMLCCPMPMDCPVAGHMVQQQTVVDYVQKTLPTHPSPAAALQTIHCGSCCCAVTPACCCCGRCLRHTEEHLLFRDPKTRAGSCRTDAHVLGPASAAGLQLKGASRLQQAA